LKIRSPWAFTALGSGLAASIRACRRVGGLTAKASGEDFYFLQKLRKFGSILLWNDRPVYPAARFSSRVHFGTGPALLEGQRGKWSPYPIYSIQSFMELEKTASCFATLFRRSVATPLQSYYPQLFGSADPWFPLRCNHRQEESFIRACHERLDGLRVRQYLRLRHDDDGQMDEDRLLAGVKWYAPQAVRTVEHVMRSGGFARAPIGLMDQLRRIMAGEEARQRIEHDQRQFGIKPTFLTMPHPFDDEAQ